MKKVCLAFVVLLLIVGSGHAQQYNRTCVCKQDTMTVQYCSARHRDSTPYKVLACTQVSNVGLRFELGISGIAYNAHMQSWVGNHRSALFGLALAYRDFTLGAKFFPATVLVQRELSFDGVPLAVGNKINPIQFEYDLSYSKPFRYNFAFEPFVAYTNSQFYVIQSTGFFDQYQFRKIGGFSLSAGLNKYFKIKDFQFFALFVRYAYSFSNYTLLNPILDRNYSSFSTGMAYKGFCKRQFYKRVD